MATPAEIRQAVDDKLVTLQAVITSRQDTFFATNGRYWQGLRTHTLNPSDGAETIPDIGAATPTDEGQAWPAVIRATAIPMTIEIHKYHGPGGHGYAVILTVTIAGGTWRRIFQVGPEAHRARPWHLTGSLL